MAFQTLSYFGEAPYPLDERVIVVVDAVADARQASVPNPTSGIPNDDLHGLAPPHIKGVYPKVRSKDTSL